MINNLKTNWFKGIVILGISFLFIWIFYQNNNEIIIREFVKAVVRAVKSIT